MPKGTIIGSVRDTLAVGSNIIESAKNELVWLLPPAMVGFAAQYEIAKKSKMQIANGVSIKSMFRISSPYITLARSLLDIGEDLRHIDQYEGVFFLVGDRKLSVSSMHVDIEGLSLDDKVVAFWSESPAYAEYLLSHFDQAWEKSVDAQERIRKLLEQGN
jgi:hypothetical protein